MGGSRAPTAGRVGGHRLLPTLAADAPGQLQVLHEEGDALGVDGRAVAVLKQPHQIGLGRLLQRLCRVHCDAPLQEGGREAGREGG